MCRTNGLKKIYESELNRKSKYYAVFDALLRNFREAEAAADCKDGTFEICKMGKILIADEKSYTDYQTDMVPFLRNGVIHLGYLLGEQKHKKMIIKVYDKVVCGLTVREIVARLSISQHTIQQCRMIAVNELYALWDLSPSVLVSAIGYTCQKGFGINDKVYLLCFEEDVPFVSDILNNFRQLVKHFAVCDLPYREVIRYVSGEIPRIE